ncbi:uncharacterized protein LOC124490445 [Dermatophagoides farinae]|uniref:uncharacterized protein LOC124490445 n=1 Tax=Dermatophagoides farinae TaxID=6954 RepID=UPI003F5FFDD0
MKCFGTSNKVYRCKIVLLDETELIQEIKESQKGQDILDIVFKHLDLLETVYFGLRFIDSKGFSNWLEPNKNAIKQVKEIEPITLYFGVKFYSSDPCKLREECTRYQFFLQIKQDIQQSRLPVTNELAAQLLAFIIQSELGDYDPKIHQFGYVSEFCWIENQSLDFENKVCDLHKKLIGQIPTAVEMQFLERVKWLDLYGCELHSVMAEDRYEYYLGLGPHGIIVLKNKLKIAYYYWPRIIKIWRKGKFFMIKVIDKNNVDKTYGFEMYDRPSTNRIYKSCKDHKEFFKLSQSIRMQPSYLLSHINDGNKLSSSSLSNGAIRMINQDFNRPNPSLIRVSSRRFRRTGVPDGSENSDSKLNNKNGQFYEGGGVGGGGISGSNNNKCLQPICRFNSTPSIPKAEYGAINPYHKSESGLFSKSASASPLSVRSAFVARYDYGRMNYVSPMKRNASSTSLRRNRSSRSADNDSEISRYSRHSSSKVMAIHSSSIHNNGIGIGGGCSSDINDGSGYMPRSRRKYYIEPRMVEWDETMDRRNNYSTMPTTSTMAKQCSNAVVRNVNKIIYQSSNHNHHHHHHDSDSETEDRRRYMQPSSPTPLHHRSNRSLNRKSTVPTEIQKYIFHEPIDTTGYTEAEKKNIQFTKIRTEPQLSKSKYQQQQQQQQSSKSDVEYYLGNRITNRYDKMNNPNFMDRKPMMNLNRIMDVHQQQHSPTQIMNVGMATDNSNSKIYYDKSNVNESHNNHHHSSNIMAVTTPPTRYYFDQRNLVNGHHYPQQQQQHNSSSISNNNNNKIQIHHHHHELHFYHHIVRHIIQIMMIIKRQLLQQQQQQ